MLNKKIINRFFIVSVSLLTAGVIILSCAKTQHFKLSQFISPDTCGGCHSEIYEQWLNSMHNIAHKDPLYVQVSLFLRKGLTNADEIKEAESCVKCHTPVGVVSGYPTKVSDDRSKVAEIAREGIQCDYCHSAVSAKKMYNNGLVLSPGNGMDDPGTKRGPFKDSKADFHKSAYSEFHTGSEICGTCHNVKHVVFDTVLESTYDEWKNGPYNSKDPAKRITCQGCHMYQRPGIAATGSTERPANPGKAADDGPDRKHIFTHYFVGGNSLIPGTMGDDAKNKMAIERLKNAATLEIDEKGAAGGEIDIIVKNTGAGHYLPTGLTDTRQMWLEIVIKDSKNRIVFSSGKADSSGYLPKKTIVYNTIFGDGKGNRVINIAKAREILSDRRIPPQSSLREKIKYPVKGSKFVSVTVKLLYRIAPQKIVDTVLGKGKLKMPVVKMAEVKKKITL